MTLGSILLACAVALAQTSEPAPEPRQTSVVVRHVERAEVVYTVHEGPYWGLGEIFGRIGAYMGRHDQTGPMFGRYLDDPMEVPPAELRAEVGFFVRGDIELEPGYQRRAIPAHEAATLVVEGPHGMSPAHHKAVLQWIDDHGYTSSGIIMEVYPPRAGQSSVIEIRIPIDGQPKIEVPASPETRSIADLAAAEAYAAVAVAVIPSGEVLPVAHRRWLLDVVDRLRVVREIVDKKYGSVADRVDKLVTPIVVRAQALRRPPPVPDVAASSVSFADGNKSKEREVALRELDRLMVRAHMKALDADEVFDRLVEVLTEVRSLVAEWGIRATPPPRPAPAGDVDK